MRQSGSFSLQTIWYLSHTTNSGVSSELDASRHENSGKHQSELAKIVFLLTQILHLAIEALRLLAHIPRF